MAVEARANDLQRRGRGTSSRGRSTEGRGTDDERRFSHLPRWSEDGKLLGLVSIGRTWEGELNGNRTGSAGAASVHHV